MLVVLHGYGIFVTFISGRPDNITALTYVNRCSCPSIHVKIVYSLICSATGPFYVYVLPTTLL